jgi:hypothetical protein
VFCVVIVTVGICVVDLFRLVVALLRHRPFAGVPRLLFTVAVLGLVVGLPSLVADSSKRLGALQRLHQVGGDTVYAQLMEVSRSQLSRAVTDDERGALTEVFVRLGVLGVTTHKGPPACVVAETCGRPFDTGWIIYPDLDMPTIAKGVKVRPGLYRY